MTKDQALIAARDLLSKRLDLPHNEEAAELLAGLLLTVFDQGYSRGRDAERADHYCEPSFYLCDQCGT